MTGKFCEMLQNDFLALLMTQHNHKYSNNRSMGPELVGDDLSPSSGGGWWWGSSELHLESVHRQITFVVHDYIWSLAFKPNEPIVAY